VTLAWVLVPGWGADATAFDAVRSRLPGIATCVVGWDEICGRGPVALQEAGAAIGPGPVGLAGWSLGALLALDAALAAPGRYAALALVSGTARFCGDGEGHPGPELRTLRLMSARLARDRSAVLRSFAHSCAAPDGGADAGRWWMAQASGFATDALARGLTALGTLDLRSGLATLSGRVRLIHGDADGIVPLAAAAELAAACPDAQVRVVPGRGHALPFTAAIEVAQLLLEVEA
jgi:pimeloyl-[acyl-carrier protein] methyl ester esterase